MRTTSLTLFLTSNLVLTVHYTCWSIPPSKVRHMSKPMHSYFVIHREFEAVIQYAAIEFDRRSSRF
ncbi:unnamed protein product [Chondrus crispus]|uniref:Secreted protein n=1 Tax=Chondrus crispus TaxID=2769 RepID=R7QNB2_CHOCR|nr:unnamed protein product [Chondrus crispus]CDF38880.1 unnamed protein product [Chondrus crispus]|eukprot:XP_005718785.1 unnamed protein product [Chondrus crispus]